MVLKSAKFLLRPWQTGDEDSLVKHANNYNIWLNLRDIFPHPYTHLAAQDWIEIANCLPDTLNLAIEVKEEAVGGIGLLFKTDIHRRTAEIGYWLGEAYWNKGIITEAVKLLSKHAFTKYDLCRLYAGIFEYNKASMKVLEKAGYTLEGIMRKALTKNNQQYDEYLYALIK